MLDSETRMVITADGGYRRGKVLELKKIVDDGVITHFNEEPGRNDFSADDDPYEVSDPDSMLEYFNMAK